MTLLGSQWMNVFHKQPALHPNNQHRRHRSCCSYSSLPLWIVLFSFLGMILTQVFLYTSFSTNTMANSRIDSDLSQQPPPFNTNKIPSNRQRAEVEKPIQGFPDENPSSSLQLIYDQPLLWDSPHESILPQWIQDYVRWHQETRQKFPGMELFTNPDAPPVLVRACLGLCGGLHDRLGQLPWDIYLANATGRVLLMAWQRPRSLENFLVPPPQGLDWTIPEEAKFGFDDIRRVRNETNLFDGYEEDHPTEEFWKSHVDAALERATVGQFRHVRVLRHRILGHLGEAELQERLAQRHGLSHDLHSAPYFGNIFRLFFRPSPAIDQEIREIMTELQLMPHRYTTVHCRVRHPKATEYGIHVVGKNPKYPADKTGLPWVGETRQFALDVASKALRCAQDTTKNDVIVPTASRTPIYFMSDSNDLVRHVAIELQDDQFVQANRSQLDLNLYGIIHGMNDAQPPSSLGLVRTRDVTLETAHLDRQKGRQPKDYYSTFIDLFVAIHARCVVYGIGYYAAFAAKLSGTTCTGLYQKEAWGSQASKQSQYICDDDRRY